MFETDVAAELLKNSTQLAVSVCFVKTRPLVQYRNFIWWREVFWGTTLHGFGKPFLFAKNGFFDRSRRTAPKGLNSELVSWKPHYFFFFMFLIIMSTHSKHMDLVISSSCTALPPGHLCSARRKEKMGKKEGKLPHANIYTVIFFWKKVLYFLICPILMHLKQDWRYFFWSCALCWTQFSWLLYPCNLALSYLTASIIPLILCVKHATWHSAFEQANWGGTEWPCPCLQRYTVN